MWRVLLRWVMANQPAKDRARRAGAAPPAAARAWHGLQHGQREQLVQHGTLWHSMARCGTAWHTVALHSMLCHGTVPPEHRAPLAFMVAHGQPGRCGRVPVKSGRCGCCWHWRHQEHHLGHDMCSLSTGAARGPGFPAPAAGSTHWHKMCIPLDLQEMEKLRVHFGAPRVDKATALCQPPVPLREPHSARPLCWRWRRVWASGLGGHCPLPARRGRGAAEEMIKKCY